MRPNLGDAHHPRLHWIAAAAGRVCWQTSGPLFPSTIGGDYHEAAAACPPCSRTRVPSLRWTSLAGSLGSKARHGDLMLTRGAKCPETRNRCTGHRSRDQTIPRQPTTGIDRLPKCARSYINATVRVSHRAFRRAPSQRSRGLSPRVRHHIPQLARL